LVRNSMTLHPDLVDRRVTMRRIAALIGALVIVSAILLAGGPLYLWPLFIFPLLLGAVFFFELGGLLVAGWLGGFFVAWFALRQPVDAAATRQAIVGLAAFSLAGLVFGRVQRDQHQLHGTLAASSLTDRLTGLYNYGTFADYLHNEVTKADRYGGELTLIMLDLDHFKRFNDRYGHEAGNDLLKRVGATLQAVIREADVAARYGGEEFALLISGDAQDGLELAERVRHAIETTALELRGGEVACVTASAGVATYPTGSPDDALLVEHADRALYESKRAGRNRVTVDPQSELPEHLSATLSA
jgi:diguanylate cyclase (GGDEF)-like protein